MDEPSKEWIKPGEEGLVNYVHKLQETRRKEKSMANCGNCHGTGRHIYKDKDGKIKDIPCLNCQGTGEK